MTTSSDAASVPSPAPDGKPAAARPHKWRRRFIWAGVGVLVITITMRVLLVVMLGSVLRSVVGRYGLTCSYERTEIYLLDGDVGIWHFTLSPKGGGAPILQSDYCRADIATLPLLRGRLVVRRAEAEGVDLLVERKADGTIPFVQQLAVFAPSSTTKAAAAPSKEVNLSAPLRADAIRVQQVRLHLHDAAVTPAFDARMELQMRLTDLGSSERPTRVGLDFTSLPALDLMRVEAEGRSTADALDLSANVSVFGLHPGALEGYLSQLGLKPAAYGIEMHAQAKVHAVPGKTPGTVAATVNVDQVAVNTDGVEALGLDRLQVDISSANETHAAISRLLISGARGNASRGAAGGLRLAGIEYAPSDARSTATPTVAASIQPEAAHVPNVPFALSLDQLQIGGVGLKFTDAGVTPTNDLAMQIDKITATHLLPGPDDAIAASDVLVHLMIPRVIGDIKVTGSSQPGAERKLNFNVNATGIGPAALRPYLASIGLESQLKNATFTCVGQATFPAQGKVPGITDAQLSQLRLADGPTLLELRSAHLAGLQLPGLAARADAAAGTGILLKSLEIAGPHPTIRRNPDGSVQALGFRKTFGATGAATSVPTSQPAATQLVKPISAPVSVATTFPVPRLQIDHFIWKDLGVTFEDASLTPPTTFEIKDAGIELNDLDLNPSSKNEKLHPAKLHGWLKAPGLADELSVDGTLLPSTTGPSLNVKVNGLGVTGNMLVGVLKQAGIEPTMQDGVFSLKATIQPSLLKTGDGLGLSIDASDLSLSDRGAILFGVKAAAIEGVEIRPNSIAVGSMKIDTPQASALREEDGSLVAAGFRLRKVQPTTRSTELPSAALRLADPPGALLAALNSISARPITLKQLQISAATGQWEDRAVKPVARLSGSADVSAQGLVIGADAPPATWNIGASAPGIAREVKAHGTLALKRNTASAHAELAVSGITGESIAPYLPKGTLLALKDGKLELSADALIALSEAGGTQAQLSVNDLDYRDADDTSALLHLDKGRINIARFDPRTQIVALSEVMAQGFEAELRTTPQGNTRAIGLEWGASNASADAEIPAAPALPAPANPPVALVPAAGARLPTTMPNGALLLQSLPLLTIDKLDLGARKITWVNEILPDAKPLTLANVTVSNPHRIELLGNDPESRPAVELKIQGAIQPVADQILLGVQLAPLASPATLAADLTVTGIHGDGLLSLAPAFKDQIDASGLTDGRLHLVMDAQAKIQHRRPIGFDLSHGIDGEFSIRSIEFRNGPSGGGDSTLLAGLDEIRGEGIKADGKIKEIDIKSIELTKPTASAVRDKDGLHVMGVLVKLPPAAMWGAPKGKSSGQSTESTTRPAIISPATRSIQTTAVRPTPIIRVDRLSISGVDFRYEDRIFEPSVLIPVAGLELEARDLSNQMMFEDKPFRWTLSANSAKMTLPVNLRGGQGAGATEQRELFAQATSDGKVALFPTPSGWAKLSISALDLADFRGVGNAIGVTLDGGNVDANIDMRFPGRKSIDTREHIVITDLGIAEPPNGPFQTFLKLPSPLNVVIGAVEDPSGGITLPLSLQVTDGKLGNILDQLPGAVASIAATAIASAPVKVVNDLFGLGKGSKQTIEPVVLGFSAGDTTVSAADVASLTRLIGLLRDDRNLDVTFQHELGEGDISRAALRANPSAEECRVLAANLHGHKLELLAARSAAAGQARGELGSRPVAQVSDSLANLREIDRELARTDSALDNLYEMLRPGADRQADRRTRAAALEIAQQRLNAIQSLLQSSGVTDISKRIHLVPPTFNPKENTAGGHILLVAIKKK